MFYHVKELEFNARVSAPDPRFASLLLEQFGGSNGELKAAMQYFIQAFSTRRPYPEHYDMLMDIATEELSHLEMVGATITMLLDGINGELKNAVENTYLSQLMQGKAQKEEMIEELIPATGAGMVEKMSQINPQFLALTGGGPALTNSQGVPWQGYFVNANGDLTVDLRSDIAAESRAKIVYEYLMQLTDDPLVKETIGFLMTREIAHFQQFSAALDVIQPNFPPGILQGDPRFKHVYMNMSDGSTPVRGPWNEGQGPWPKGEQWQYVDRPMEHVLATNGMVDQPVKGGKMDQKETHKMDQKLSEERSQHIKKSMPKGEKSWSDYDRR